MAPFVAPSSDLALTIGYIERKVDMSLDDIIKQSKVMDKKQHTKVKDWNRTRIVQPVQATQVQHTQVQQRGQEPYRRDSWQKREPQQGRVPQQRTATGKGPPTQVQHTQVQQRGQELYRRDSWQKRELQQGRVPQQRKDLLQRFVALRSSALRQGKLNEARARNGTSTSTATKAVGQEAFSGNAVVSLNRVSRKATQGSVRPVGAAARYPKMLTAARNPKVLIVNQLSMTRASRRPDAPRIGPLAKGATAEPQRPRLHPNMVMARNSGRKLQTLDSRFASLREERQLQSQFAPHAGWGR